MNPYLLTFFFILICSTPSQAEDFYRPIKIPEINITKKATSSSFERYILFKLSDPKYEKIVISNLPHGTRRVTLEEKYLLTQLPKIPSVKDINAYKKIPHVISVQKGGTLHTLSDCSSSHSDNSNFEKLKNSISQLTQCDLVERCTKQKNEKLWAQRQVDATFLSKTASLRGVQKGDERVAVIDSGFDLKKNQPLMISDVEVMAGYDDAGSLETDEDGHGTAVAGTIGAIAGIGVSPHAKLTVYRVTPKGGSGGLISDAASKIAVLRACNDGNTIINASWSKTSVESGQIKEETFTEDFLSELSGKGCLVIQAAGNSAYRLEKIDSANNDSSEALITVAATDAKGNTADFSSAGVIAAPGQGVYTLYSGSLGSMNAKMASALAMVLRGCEKYQDIPPDGQFVNGTSFAAPITAGIAAETQGILKKSKNYATLNNKDKVKLLSRILKASMYAGSISGARAAIMAERWADNNSDQVPTIDQLAESIYIPPQQICNEKIDAPDALECSDLKLLFAQSTLQAKICKNSNLKYQKLPLEIAISANDWELAVREFRNLSSELNKTQEGQEEINQYAKRLWHQYIGLWSTPKYSIEGANTKIPEYLKFDANNPYETSLDDIIMQNIDFPTAVELLPYYFKSLPNSGAGKSELKKSLKIFLNSAALPKRIYWRQGLHHASANDNDLQKMMASFKIYFDKDPEGFKKTINQWFNSKVEDTNFLNFLRDRRYVDTDQAGAIAWLLNALVSDPHFKNIHPELMDLQNTLYKSLSLTSNLISVEHLDYFEKMLNKNRNNIENKIKIAIQKNDFSKFGAIDLLWIFKNPDLLKDKQEKFYYGLFKKLSKGDGWGVSDFTLSLKGLEFLFNSIIENKTSFDAKKSQNQINEIFQDSNSIHFMLATVSLENQFRTIYNAIKNESQTEIIEKKSDILSILTPEDTLIEHRRLLSNIILNNFNQKKNISIYELHSYFDILLPGLVKDKNSISNKTMKIHEIIPDNTQDRHSWFKMSDKKFEIISKNGSEIMESYMALSAKEMENILIQMSEFRNKDDTKSQVKWTSLSTTFMSRFLRFSTLLSSIKDKYKIEGEFSKTVNQIKESLKNSNETSAKKSLIEMLEELIE